MVYEKEIHLVSETRVLDVETLTAMIEEFPACIEVVDHDFLVFANGFDEVCAQLVVLSLSAPHLQDVYDLPDIISRCFNQSVDLVRWKVNLFGLYYFLNELPDLV